MTKYPIERPVFATEDLKKFKEFVSNDKRLNLSRTITVSTMMVVNGDVDKDLFLKRYEESLEKAKKNK